MHTQVYLFLYTILMTSARGGRRRERLHMDGTGVISLVPNHSRNVHLLQKVMKKINMEKGKETHKTGILWT